MNADGRAGAARVLAVLDLTSLGEDDTRSTIESLCKAAAAGGHPAAVCVYPEHVETARRMLDSLDAADVAVATVVNFPDGSNDLGRALRETRRALAAGAAEIDIVFPWRAYIDGDRESGPLMLQGCKDLCGARLLKAILETGELGDPLLIREMSLAALGSGADFIKTSTGKTASGATIAAARVVIQCLRERNGRGGFKAAGGIRTLAEAGRYLALADEIMGPGWTTPAQFRIGASALITEIRSVLGP
ncbi:MAG: deoxyribose-phosphate aldolase [Steroidobacteraceae bacterium]